MPTGRTLIDYGIAINFFGNYRQEASKIGGITDRLNNSLLSLQNLVLGGSLTYGLYKFSDAILTTALMMEQNFAALKASLGSAAKAIETLEWARVKGAETPFEIDEVNRAVTMMTTMGFNKNDQMREEVFNAIGDFAGLRGAGFSDIMGRVAKATFGNWESLGDTYGIRQSTIGGMVRDQVSRTPEKFAGEMDEINNAIKTIESGKKGTEEYRMSIVKLIGVLGRGGMVNRLNTIGGAWSNVNDLIQNFMFNMVGYSQIEGTFANAIKNTIKNGILEPFMETHEVVINGIKEQITTVDQLGRIGKGVGELLTGMWDLIDNQVGKATNSLVGWIDKIDQFFADYEQNIAPIVLFIALVKLQIEDFLSGFYEGFTSTFGLFLKMSIGVIKGLASIAERLGIGKTKAEALGKVLGGILGTLIGIKVFRMATMPLQPLINGAGVALKYLKKVFLEQRAVLMGDGVLTASSSVWKQFATTLQYLSYGLRGASASAWSFTVALLTNPITWIVIAVIALVGWLYYLITHWEEIGEKMQNVSDIALAMLSFFMPIVGIPLIMAKYWGEFQIIFYNIWRGITGYLRGIAILLKHEVINPIKEGFSGLWDGVKEKVGQFIDFIKKEFPFVVTMFEDIEKIWSSIAGFFTDIWDKITNSNFIQSMLNAAIKLSDRFGDGGSQFEEKMLDKYGEDKNDYYNRNKEYYEKVGAAQKSIDKRNQTTVDVGGVTIVQGDGEDGTKLGEDFMEGLQNNLGKEGK